MKRLAIGDLQVRFGDRQVVAVDELSLDAAEIVGLAGESGSGKSMTTLAVLGLAHTVGATVSGSIKLDGTDPEYRAERHRRALEDGRDPAPAYREHLALRHGGELGAVQLDAAADRGADRVRQAEHGERGHRLA